MIVADTNVLSELLRQAPNPDVRDWVEARAGNELYTSAITVAEMSFGVERLPDGRRRDRLRRAVTGLFAAFEDRILTFDVRAATAYGALVAAREEAGQPISMADAQIAAVVRVHGASLATRNVSDFDGLGLEVIDPWDQPTDG